MQPMKEMGLTYLQSDWFNPLRGSGKQPHGTLEQGAGSEANYHLEETFYSEDGRTRPRDRQQLS